MKYAVVTGGTRGIGKAIAISLLQQGYNVVVGYKSNETNANEFEHYANSTYSGKLNCIQCDLSNVTAVGTFYDKVLSTIPFIDVLVLNAGVTDRSTFEEIDAENWGRVFETNLNVPFFLIKAFLNDFRQDGNVIFIGSTMGRFAHSASLSYGVSKAAVHALVKNLVKFLRNYSLRVNGVVPGFIETDWHADKSQHVLERIHSKISVGKFGQPHDVAQAVVFLLSNHYINGELVAIDGGYNYI
jgi:3-oxoacyl-[acyl-carrier protein] reductase